MNLPEINTDINYNIASPKTPSFKTKIKYNHFTLSDEEFPPLSIDKTFDNDYIKPEKINNKLNNDNNLDQNYFNPTHNYDTRLKDVDNRILKFSDFHSISYFMFFWALLCFLLSIWDITHLSNYKQIQFLNNIKKEVENILTCFVNFYHCGVYLYGIRTYNLQSIGMKISNKMLLSITIINFIYFFIYLFFVPISFFTFFVDLIYLIFNAFLFFQSSELTKLYDEKYNIKLIYL